MALKSGGFTLVEIMIVVAILGMITAIALPNFVKARDKSVEVACIANARQLQTAIATAALSSQTSLPANDLSEDAISTIVCPSYIKSMPHCSKGTYYTDATGNVMCTFHNPSVQSSGSLSLDVHQISAGFGNNPDSSDSANNTSFGGFN